MAEQWQLIHPSVSVMLTDLMWHVSDVLAQQAKLAPPSACTAEYITPELNTHMHILYSSIEEKYMRMPSLSIIDSGHSLQQLLCAQTIY